MQSVEKKLRFTTNRIKTNKVEIILKLNIKIKNITNIIFCKIIKSTYQEFQ